MQKVRSFRPNRLVTSTGCSTGFNLYSWNLSIET